MLTKLHQATCNHKYAIETIDYCTEEITCTQIDHRIVCRKCGKEIIPTDKFNGLLELLTMPSSQDFGLMD